MVYQGNNLAIDPCPIKYKSALKKKDFNKTILDSTNLFIKKYLEQQNDRIVSTFEMISELLDPVRWPHPEIPTRQMQWLLIVVCLQFMGD